MAIKTFEQDIINEISKRLKQNAEGYLVAINDSVRRQYSQAMTEYHSLLVYANNQYRLIPDDWQTTLKVLRRTGQFMLPKENK